MIINNKILVEENIRMKEIQQMNAIYKMINYEDNISNNKIDLSMTLNSNDDMELIKHINIVPLNMIKKKIIKKELSEDIINKNINNNTLVKHINNILIRYKTKYIEDTIWYKNIKNEGKKIIFSNTTSRFYYKKDKFVDYMELLVTKIASINKDMLVSYECKSNEDIIKISIKCEL